MPSLVIVLLSSFVTALVSDLLSSLFAVLDCVLFLGLCDSVPASAGVLADACIPARYWLLANCTC